MWRIFIDHRRSRKVQDPVGSSIHEGLYSWNVSLIGRSFVLNLIQQFTPASNIPIAHTMGIVQYGKYIT